MKSTNIEFVRFLFAGGINTLVTYLLYLALLNYLHYTAAYSVAYVAGIVGSYYLNCYLVFKEQPKLRSAIRYPLVYLVQYFIGVFLLYVFVNWVGLDQKLSPLIVIAITVPITFLLSRRLIRS